MSFIAGAVIIGAGAALAGGAISASGSKSAAKTAAAGSAKEIEFNRESRDIARADQAPYREAGYEALDALRSLTGLGGPRGGGSAAPVNTGPLADAPAGFAQGGMGRSIGSRVSSYARQHPRYAGGPMTPDTIYNVNELGPENIYSKGKVTRGKNPATIDGQTGYVEPNIQGRAAGGFVNRNDVYGRVGAPDVMSGPKPSYQTLPMQNTANSTAINPATGYPNENPGGVEGGYQFQTDPGYQFRFSEGMRALDRGAAAKGGLLSGGYGRKAMRYGQDYASAEYTNVYNRIANIAGLGQTSAQNSGQAALYAGQNMGTAAAQGGYARASGYQAAGNAWANAGNQIAQLPWGNVFNRNAPPQPGLSGSNGGPI